MRNFVLLAFPVTLILLTGFLAWSCSRSDTGNKRAITIQAAADIHEPVIYEIGNIQAGSSRQFVVKLKNTRQTPMIIKQAQSFCGCTVPEFEQEPVQPGRCADIHIAFMPNQLGTFSKSVKIYLNFSEEPVEIKLTGEVTGRRKN
ncbi:MAG: DUF1573 domain-containing protein [Mangrovibacterium sp.]|jgi:hypothetical protein